MKAKIILFMAAVLTVQAGMAQSNPSSANSQSATALAADDTGIYYDYYQSYSDIAIPADSAEESWTEQWQNGGGGFEVDISSNWDVGYPYIYVKYIWPGFSWPQFWPYPTNVVSYYGSSWQTNNLSSYYVPLNEAYADNVESTEYGTSPPYVEETRKSDVHVKMKLKTGGPPGSTQKRLYVVSGTLNGGASPPQEMAVGNLGYLGNDGNLYVVLPDNSPPIDVTPYVAGMNSYSFQLNQPTKYTPVITANGNSLDTTTPEFCVGQNVTFDVGGLPSLADAVAFWKLPGTFVNTQSSVCDAYYYVNPNLLINDLVVNGTLATSCWFVKDLQSGSASVDLQLYFSNGQKASINASGQFDVYRPQIITYHPYYHGTPGITATNGLLAVRHHVMNFEHSIQSDFPGVAGYTQLVGGEWQTDPEGIPLNGTELDTAEFPEGQVPINPVSTTTFNDGPHVSLSDNSTETTEDLEFNTYLMFKPNGSGNIFVPLRLVNWEVHDSATPNSGVWTPGGSATITSQGDTTAFPYWTNTFTGGF